MNVMDQMTIMRRANGELFTLQRKGVEHLALWPSLRSANHYKQRNRELLVFVPSSTASAFGKRSLAAVHDEQMPLFLLADDGNARFRDGRSMTWAELDSCESYRPANQSQRIEQLSSSERGNETKPRQK